MGERRMDCHFEEPITRVSSRELSASMFWCVFPFFLPFVRFLVESADAMALQRRSRLAALAVVLALLASPLVRAASTTFTANSQGGTDANHANTAYPVGTYYGGYSNSPVEYMYMEFPMSSMVRGIGQQFIGR